MKIRISPVSGRWWGLVLAGTLYGLGPVLAAELTDALHETHPLSERGQISLDNVNGRVVITAWDRAEVQLDAVKKARRQADLDSMQIEVKASADRLEIRTRYPDRNKNHSGSVEYTLKVPRDARLDKVSCVNGEVSVQDVTGAVQASTVNGRLRASGLAGDTKLSSVNGALDATFTTLEGVESISLSTVNGALTLALPADASARIKAHTLNGGLKNDFGLAEKKGQFVGHDLKATLGKGTTAVDLDTVNGAIRISKSER